MITSFMIQNCMPVSYHECHFRKNEIAREGLQNFAMRLLTGIDRNGPNNRNGRTTRIGLNIYVDCIRTGWPSIVTVSVKSENYGAKFAQMKLLTRKCESVRWGDNLLTCLRQCMQYWKIDIRSTCCVSQKLLKQ